MPSGQALKCPAQPREKELSEVGVIYQIKFIGGRKSYIGSTNNFENRKRRHVTELRKGSHHSHILQKAFSKYGEAAMFWVILEMVNDRSMLIVREQAWLDACAGRLYNSSPTALSRLGVVVSPETRRKLSKALLGNKNNRKVPLPFCGRGHAMAGENIYSYRLRSGRVCRGCKTCFRLNAKIQKSRRKAMT